MDEPSHRLGGDTAVICWDRQGDHVIGHFTPRQIGWLRDHVGTFRDAVLLDQEWRELECHLVDVLDVAEIAQEYRQQVLAIVSLSTGEPAWSAAEAKMGSAFAGHMLLDAELVLGALPATGGVVVLPDARHVWAWIWSLYECGMHLAFRLGLTWGPPRTRTFSAVNRTERSFSKVMTWLTEVVDTLIDVADLVYPETTV